MHSQVFHRSAVPVTDPLSTMSCSEPKGMPLGRTQETLKSTLEGGVVLGGHYALEVTVRTI
jgi:hypothetical protein